MAPIEKLRASYKEALELADGEAVDACGILLDAVRTFLGESDAREEAVARVDRRHGYTAEFAPDPAAHRAEYDAEEGS